MPTPCDSRAPLGLETALGMSICMALTRSGGRGTNARHVIVQSDWQSGCGPLRKM